MRIWPCLMAIFVVRLGTASGSGQSPTNPLPGISPQRQELQSEGASAFVWIPAALLFLLLGLVLLYSYGQAKIVEEFKVRGWQGSAITFDLNGQFGYCSIASPGTASTTDLQLIIYAYADGRTALGFPYNTMSIKGWNTLEGGRVTLSLKIGAKAFDPGPFLTRVARTAGPSELVIDLQPDDPLIEPLRTGKVMTIIIPETSGLLFATLSVVSVRDPASLFRGHSDAFAALEEAKKCVMRHKGKT